jgi:hypothetical protein
MAALAQRHDRAEHRQPEEHHRGEFVAQHQRVAEHIAGGDVGQQQADLDHQRHRPRARDGVAERAVDSGKRSVATHLGHG